MKKKLFSSLLLGLFTVVAPLACLAQITPTNFFSDSFSNGSTVNSATPAPPGTSFTSYEEISGKTWNPIPSVGANDLRFGIAATTSGSDEIQALFSTNAVNLVAPGMDYIQLVIVFTNTSGGLLTTGQGFLGFGLYNSGSSTNYPAPGGLDGTATSSQTTATTANAALWQGYFAQVAYSGSSSAIITRPAQNGPDNNNQDLLTTGSGTYSFSHPTGSDVGSTVTSSLILGTNVPYTEVLTIWLISPNSEAISNSLYAGSGISGTPLTQFGGVATNSTLLSASFNAFAMGWYQKISTHSNQVDISSITISGYETAVTGPPDITSEPVTTYVATNGSCAFSVSSSGFNVSYQWQRNGTNLTDGGNISGATSDTLIISPATATDALSAANGYSVVVTGAGDFSTNSVTNALVLIPSTNLVWTDSNPDNGWDVNDAVNGLNWEDTNGNPTVFNYGDPVTFNDVGAGGFVNLSNNYLSAASVTVSGTSPYIFQGPGSIAGPGPLDYIGSGRLTLDANNTYSGGTLISNATAYVLLQNYAGLGVGPVTLGLAGGQMEIVPAGTASSGIAGNVNVADNFTILPDADSSFGVVFLGDLSGTPGKTLSFIAGPGNPNTNTIRIRAYGNSTVYNANLDVPVDMLFAPYSSSGSQTYNGVISDAGAFMEKGTITYLNGPNTYTGGTYPAQGAIGLGISSVGSPGALTSGPIGTGPLLLMPDSTTTLTGNGQIFASAPDITIGNAIEYPSGTNNLTLEIGGANNLTLAGPFTLQGNDGVTTNKFTARGLDVTNTALTTISGVISDGGLNYGLNVTGNGVLGLDNTETYTGPTTISNATLLVNGQIGAGAVTVATNATLGGTGTITGPVTIMNSGTLAAGDQAVGALTINSSLTFGAASTNRVLVNGTANTASLVVANSVTYNGILFATNISGTLSAGDSFTICNAASHSGNFSAIAGSPGYGLSWSFNPANGVLSVVAIATNPTNITFSISGGNLNLSWPSDHLGWYLQVQTNSVAKGISTNWVTVPNSGSVDSTNFPIVPSNGTVFYRLMYP
jgi:hypothetical protein